MPDHVYRHNGGCHCGAIHVTLCTPRPPQAQILGACQCSFCRKHNVRAFSDPRSRMTITVQEPEQLARYVFGWRTSEALICRRCGVYVAMILPDGERWLGTMNMDLLDDRAQFTQPAEPRDYGAETAAERVARRKARWTPTDLVGLAGLVA